MKLHFGVLVLILGLLFGTTDATAQVKKSDKEKKQKTTATKGKETKATKEKSVKKET